jgi:ferrous iron transport protein A
MRPFKYTEEKIVPITNQNKTEEFPLSKLKKGQKAIVVHIEGKGAVKRRMMDMGLVPGSEIRVVRVAPFGDPIEFNVKGYSLSLRKSEAVNILVAKVQEGND